MALKTAKSSDLDPQSLEDIHFSESRLSNFYAKWAMNPDSVSDDEFFDVQSHLLACDACCRVGKRCEDRARSRSTAVAA